MVRNGCSVSIPTHPKGLGPLSRSSDAPGRDIGSAGPFHINYLRVHIVMANDKQSGRDPDARIGLLTAVFHLIASVLSLLKFVMGLLFP